jgi:hypothetical protein
VDQADDDKILAASFFDQPTEKVAHDLIGCLLHWKNGEELDSRIITETEAYVGPDDLASHAARGRTKRNEAMFGPPGFTGCSMWLQVQLAIPLLLQRGNWRPGLPQRNTAMGSPQIMRKLWSFNEVLQLRKLAKQNAPVGVMKARSLKECGLCER